MLMITLQITKDQVFSLIDQLSFDEQQEVVKYLIQKNHCDLDDMPDDVVIESIREAMSVQMPPVDGESFVEGILQGFKGKLDSSKNGNGE
jgi:hypothetical protein